MGKRKQVKKNVGENRQGEIPSSSSKSSAPTRRSLREKKETTNQVQVPPKKMKKNKDNSSDSVSVGQGHGQGSQVKERNIEDLPPEMLTEILKHVDTFSLLRCRLISRNLNEISSKILTTRWETVLLFVFKDDGEFVLWDASAKEVPGQSLKNFVKLMKKSTSKFKSNHFPFAGFHFRCTSTAVNLIFDHKDWKEFVKMHEKKTIKYLNLEFFYNDETGFGKFLSMELGDLLLKKIPHVEELELEIISIYEENDGRLRLGMPQNLASVPIPFPVQLPNLKILHLEQDMILAEPALLRDVLNAAVNLKSIVLSGAGSDPLCEGDFLLEAFQLLHSMQKIHLVKVVEIEIPQASQDFLSAMTRLTRETQRPLDFKLKKLNVSEFLGNIINNPNFYPDATNFISNLLESSKNTLQELEMTPLGFLQELKFPQLKNLRTITMFRGENSDDSPFFPPGINYGREIFPVVCEFETWKNTNWLRAFPQEDSIPIFRLVKNWKFMHYEHQEGAISKFAIMCPNLKNLKILKFNSVQKQFNFVQVAREIWTHMQQLESLEIDVNARSFKYEFPALDSCFTGISPENCRRLNDLMKADKTQIKLTNKGTLDFQRRIPEAELNLLTARTFPSILDMKELKTFKINPYSGTKSWNKFLKKKLSWISQEFAFKFLSHLKPKEGEEEERLRSVVSYALRSRSATANSYNHMR